VVVIFVIHHFLVRKQFFDNYLKRSVTLFNEQWV